MKTLILFVCSAIITCSAFSQWNWQNPLPTGDSYPCFSVAFPTATTGYAAGAGGTILKTKDAGLTWELYRHRAEAETQIRELKESYGLEGFCCEDFGATEAAFRWVCVAYNLMSLYKTALINSKRDPTLATLKFQCIAIASYLVRHSRKTTLAMSVNDRRKAFFDGLFQKIEQITPKSKFLLKKKFLMN
ncbi:MAG: transposase [Bacteroidales bacterium]|jgi:hypothetical protein|nr:transposase [Bacteroidales bacterium]